MTTDPQDNIPGNDATPHRPRQFAMDKKLWLALVVAVVLLVLGGRWLYHRFNHITIDDARVDGEVVTISSRVAGWISALPVIEGDAVKQGQLLARIDDRDSKLQREVLLARLGAIESQMGVVRAQTGQVDQETLGKYQSETNRLIAAESEVASLELQVTQARDDYKRAEDLTQKKWLSQQAMERARTTYRQIEENHRKAIADVAAARGNLSSAGGSRKQLQVIERQQLVLAHQADEIRAEVRRQETDMADRSILAPTTGKVVMTFARQGEHVVPGQRILMFHDPAQIWVEANVRETDVGKLTVGMPATIRVDAFPGKVFNAKVHRIGQAATSKFALLPDPNPSGNFTRITQRLPVRILIDEPDAGLRPGMMVEVEIDVRNH